MCLGYRITPQDLLRVKEEDLGRSEVQELEAHSNYSLDPPFFSSEDGHKFTHAEYHTSNY